MYSRSKGACDSEQEMKLAGCTWSCPVPEEEQHRGTCTQEARAGVMQSRKRTWRAALAAAARAWRAVRASGLVAAWNAAPIHLPQKHSLHRDTASTHYIRCPPATCAWMVQLLCDDVNCRGLALQPLARDLGPKFSNCLRELPPQKAKGPHLDFGQSSCNDGMSQTGRHSSRWFSLSVDWNNLYSNGLYKLVARGQCIY